MEMSFCCYSCIDGRGFVLYLLKIDLNTTVCEYIHDRQGARVKPQSLSYGVELRTYLLKKL